MSEQEKMSAIPAEGAVTEAKVDERSWMKKLVDAHPKAWKWAKRIGAGLGVGSAMFAAYEIGKASGGGSANTETVCIEGETNDTEDDEVTE